MSIDAAEKLFKKCMPEIWLVTSAHGRSAGGLIATFVMKASLVAELPRVAIGIAKHHYTWELIDRSRAFCLHLLADDNVELVTRFGLQSGRSTDKFDGLPYRTNLTGSPILDAGVGWLDCRMEADLDIGDRTIFVGEVVAGEVSSRTALTVDRLMALLSQAELKSLADAVARDSATDAEAIRDWRTTLGSHSTHA